MTLFGLGRILICVPVILLCWPAAAQIPIALIGASQAAIPFVSRVKVKKTRPRTGDYTCNPVVTS